MKRLQELINFLLKEFPAFLRQKPSIRRVLLLPFLVVFLLFRKKRPLDKKA